MAEPLYISPSAVAKYRRCKRLIGFVYVEKIREPATKKQEFGQEVHGQLECWLKDGRPPDESEAGRVADQALQRGVLPTPGPHLRVEEKFEIPAPDCGEDVVLTGYIDLEEPGEVPVVTDHKTTSDLKWAMTSQELSRDPQGLLYAAASMMRTGARRVRARWNYLAASNPKSGPRKPKGARGVEAVFDRDDPAFLANLEGVKKDVREITRIRRAGVRGKNLDPSPERCDDYGGCYFRNVCDIPPEDRAVALVLTDCAHNAKSPSKEGEMSDLSLLQKLQNLQPGEAKGVNPPPVAPPPAQAAAPPVEVNPANIPVARPEDACPHCGRTYKRLATHLKSCPHAPKEEAAPASVQTTVQPPVQTTVQPPVQTTVQPPVATTSPPQQAPAPAPTEQVFRYTEGFVVIFDAVFAKNETITNSIVRLENILKPLADAVASQNQKDHWQMTPYAQGGPQLAAKLEQWIDGQNGMFRGVILADSQMAETKACREVLVRRAGVVVVGVR